MVQVLCLVSTLQSHLQFCFPWRYVYIHTYILIVNMFISYMRCLHAFHTQKLDFQYTSDSRCYPLIAYCFLQREKKLYKKYVYAYNIIAVCILKLMHVSSIFYLPFWDIRINTLTIHRYSIIFFFLSIFKRRITRYMKQKHGKS